MLLPKQTPRQSFTLLVSMTLIQLGIVLYLLISTVMAYGSFAYKYTEQDFIQTLSIGRHADVTSDVQQKYEMCLFKINKAGTLYERVINFLLWTLIASCVLSIFQLFYLQRLKKTVLLSASEHSEN